jgi:hypothetical protein
MDPLGVARSGALSLANLLRDDGSFRYRFNAGSKEDLGGYNALRHAGAIWSIIDVYTDLKDPQLLLVARHATTFLVQEYLKFYRSYNNACICEKNSIKLGGNGLASLALTSLYEVTKESSLQSLSEQLCNFIVSQKEETGELVHKRFFRSGKISEFRSEYYVGEALLAMLVLYRNTQEARWLELAREMEVELAQNDYGVEQQSHWMLYFLEQLSSVESAPQYYQHAAKIAEHILDNPAYLDWQRSTPIACRSEGLLAFLRMSDSIGAEGQGLISRCMEQVEFNLQRQLEFQLDDGAFIRGGNDRRHSEVRIDYIQHNISSFLHYHRLMKNGA